MWTRRSFIAGTCAVCAAARAGAAPLAYDLDIRQVASGTWVSFGRTEAFSQANGGNIVNCAFIAVPDGVVVIDTGSSRRHGEALRAAIEHTLPGKPILRVYNTHHHPDHMLGNQAFPAGALAAPQGVIDGIRRDGEAFAGNLYRLIGDWMRGTAVSVPGTVLSGAGEEVGGRRFAFHHMSGHTASDFAIRDMETGLLFTGDLCFLNRAPTTPHADLPRWLASLDALARVDRTLLVPGHGPGDTGLAAIDQTRDWLTWLDGTLRDALLRYGFSANEAIGLPIPPRFAALGVAREEFIRSVAHLFPKIEDELLPPVAVTR
jgi:uncharacterized sulfatase